jgi:PKHD-type hydroxylase
MFLEVQNLLKPQEINRLRELAGRLKFTDGRLSNPGNSTKDNLQADLNDPGYHESSKILADALQRTQAVADFALPKVLAPPLLCRYDPNMKYGPHADTAYIVTPGGRMRTDVSCTIFISDPESYEGGALRIHLGTEVVDVKYPAGHAILYPSHTVHEVIPVKQGQRLVGITFIESLVPSQEHREMIYELNEVGALEGFSMKMENRVRLDTVKSNLIRMWST